MNTFITSHNKPASYKCPKFCRGVLKYTSAIDSKVISNVSKYEHKWIKSIGPEGGIWIINEGFSILVQLTIPKKAVNETVTLTCKFILYISGSDIFNRS